ncbi:MAG: hypothetical protein PHU40_07225 [Sulfurimonas sp.]|nr:hypothetical protein [Sulfurimonas sp.]
MKTFLLFLMISSAAFAALPFTLDNMESLRVRVVNKSDFMSVEQTAKIKEEVSKKLSKAGIAIGAPDSPTLMLKIDAIQVNDHYVVNTSITIGEEVITKRNDAVQTLAFTYNATDFFKTNEPYADTMESVHYLLDDFIEAYKDDKE